MLSVEQHQDVLDVIKADHADGSPFTVAEVAMAAASPLVAGDSPPPSESEVHLLVKSWEWQDLVTPSFGEEMYFWRPEVLD